MNPPAPYSPGAWVPGFPAAVTVCDARGVILEMNAQAEAMFAEEGGRALIGSNLLDCHPEPARARLQGMLATQQPNVYTIEKGGLKELIYQTPWFLDGRFAGFVEMAIELPADMPHHVRAP